MGPGRDCENIPTFRNVAGYGEKRVPVLNRAQTLDPAPGFKSAMALSDKRAVRVEMGQGRRDEKFG